MKITYFYAWKEIEPKNMCYQHFQIIFCRNVLVKRQLKVQKNTKYRLICHFCRCLEVWVVFNLCFCVNLTCKVTRTNGSIWSKMQRSFTFVIAVYVGRFRIWGTHKVLDFVLDIKILFKSVYFWNLGRN